MTTILGSLAIAAAAFANAQASVAPPAAEAPATPSEIAFEVARLRLNPAGMISTYKKELEAKLPQFIAATPRLSAALANRPDVTAAALRDGEEEADRQIAALIAGPASIAVARVLERRYSQAELSQLLAFYATEVGQRVSGAWPSDHNVRNDEDAANSPAGRAFLSSSLGKRENSGGFAEADRAAAEAVNAKMPAVHRAVMQRTSAALATALSGHTRP